MSVESTLVPGERLNILLVDDQPAKLLTYEAILQDLGDRLIKAHTAREALEYLLLEEIAVILMDVSMPDVDGFELASMIRQHPRCQRTSIIFVSAVHLTDLDRLRGYETGAVDYVPVPVVPQVLRAKVSVFLELFRKTRQLERLNADLERRVASRTEELEASTARLRASEEGLREADRRKDEFLAILAHELRNPLAPIRNALTLMRSSSSLSPEVTWSRDLIERQVDQLARLVDDLLDVSRVSRGKIELKRELLELEEVVAAGIETSRPHIDGRQHELVLRFPESPVRVFGDRIRLTQVVSNLLNNAAKFQEKGGKITVIVDRDGGDAIVRIEDRGIGIAPETLPRVFDLFVQYDHPTTRTERGLGIGLSLVKDLLALHDGSVSAHSDGLGHGSEFVIRLPCRGDAVRTAPLAEMPQRGPARRRQRILVVDDNRDAAISLALLLRHDGHEVEVAHDGPEALRLASLRRPEVVLLDLGMPQMDGFEVCRAFRERGHDAFMVALTGYGQEEDRRRSREAGFDSHLVKPALPDVIAKLLADRSDFRTRAPSSSA